jgi:RNA-directed DNA polymerase
VTPVHDLGEMVSRLLASLSEAIETFVQPVRQVRWKEWKRVRTKPRKLRAAGIPEHDARRWAFSRKGYWRIAGSPVLSTALPSPSSAVEADF